MLSTVILILSGNAFSSLVLLARNLIIARLLSLEDFGIAATFAISIAIVEMASGLGLQQLIVQDKEGEDPKLQAGLHGFNLLRGILSGLALYLLAAPIAHFLGIPEVTWAYQLLALVPVIRGFEHFDIHRLNRTMTFGPLILTKTVPAFLSVLSIWPLFMIFEDFRVMLFSVMLQWVLLILATHLVAQRRFTLNFDNATLRKGLNFGWPLLINNFLLFLVFQGDRMLVGRELGMETLAIFSVGITLTLTPTLVSASSEQLFFLPQLSAARGNRERFAPLAYATMQASLASGLLLVLAVTAIREPLIGILFGSKYAPLVALLPWLAIWQAMRAFKVGNTVVALSLAQTSNAMIANGVRCLALPLAWWTIWQGGDLIQLIWIAIAGEFCGYILSTSMALKRGKLSCRMLLPSFFFALAALICAAYLTEHPPAHTIGTVTGWCILCGLIGGSIWTMKELRQYVLNRDIGEGPHPA